MPVTAVTKSVVLTEPGKNREEILLDSVCECVWAGTTVGLPAH
jgi:hypothetical protein